MRENIVEEKKQQKLSLTPYSSHKWKEYLKDEYSQRTQHTTALSMILKCICAEQPPYAPLTHVYKK